MSEGQQRAFAIAWAWSKAVAIPVLAIALAVVQLEARAQDAGAKAAAPALLQAETTARELEATKREWALRFERLEQQGNRTEAKVDELKQQNALQMAALLERFRIPNPAPADAGH